MRRPVIVLSLIVLAVAGCSARNVPYSIDPSKISYSYDSRTKICFGSLGRQNSGWGLGWLLGSSDSFSIASVECNEDVLKLAGVDPATIKTILSSGQHQNRS